MFVNSRDTGSSSSLSSWRARNEWTRPVPAVSKRRLSFLCCHELSSIVRLNYALLGTFMNTRTTFKSVWGNSFKKLSKRESRMQPLATCLTCLVFNVKRRTGTGFSFQWLRHFCVLKHKLSVPVSNLLTYTPLYTSSPISLPPSLCATGFSARHRSCMISNACARTSQLREYATAAAAAAATTMQAVQGWW